MALVGLSLSGCTETRQPDTIASDFYYRRASSESDTHFRFDFDTPECPSDIPALTQRLYEVNKQSEEAHRVLEEAEIALMRSECQEDIQESGLSEAVQYATAAMGE